MKIETLRKDWQAKNPGGNIWIALPSGELLESGKQTGKFAVTYTEDGKIYTYQYKSVYALAERLGMIPVNNYDYWVESRKAIEAMNKGESFISICGLSDTIRYILGNNEKDMLFPVLDHDNYGKDEYDRNLYIFKGYKIYSSYADYEASKK